MLPMSKPMAPYRNCRPKLATITALQIHSTQPSDGFLANSNKKSANFTLPVVEEFHPNFAVYSMPMDKLHLRL